MKMRYLIVIILVAVIIGQIGEVKRLKVDNKRLSSNQELLLNQKVSILAESQKYKVSDSLNAAKVSQLQLTLKEYKAYNTDNLKLVEQLNIKKSELEKIVDTKIETINSLSAKLKDTIRVDTTTNIADTIKHFNYISKWTDVKGYIHKDNIDLQIKNRESLKIIETTKYKRFLGFLWKIGIKDNQVDVISENPNTTIVNLEYIKIKR